MKKKTNLTKLHCIFFIYYTFASYNNGRAEKNEVSKIINYIKSWSTGGNHNTIIREVMVWASDIIQSPEEAISTMFSMADYLNSEPDFDVTKKEKLLLDIREISRIDGVFSEKEKKWHDLLAHHLDVNLRISSCSKEEIRLGRQKIGFVPPKKKKKTN